MKKYLYMMLAVCTLSACQKVNLDEEVAPATKQSKSVMFVMNGITEEYSTRATITSVGCTDMWVWEGTTLLCHKVSTDADFDTPSISLTYGSHDLTFVASSSKGQAVADGVWSTTKVIDDYAVTMNVTVSSGSSNSRQVQLTRRNSRINVVTTDNVPTTVTKCHIKSASHDQLDASLNGLNAFTYDTTVDITSKQGSTYSVFVNTLTASPTEEEDCAVTVEFLDASGSVLYTYDRTLTMKANRCVTLTGAFFSGASNAISIASTDFEEVTQELYE